MSKKVLITGISGLVGSHLSRLLQEKGYEVAGLSRKEKVVGKIRHYAWDVDKQIIDPEALKEVDYIVHLAGASVAGGRWTDERKKEIMDSRVKSTQLLLKQITAQEHPLSAFIGASAIGLYGDRGDELLDEESAPANHDFLADVVKAWEQEVDTIANTGIRTVKVRIGVVLSDKDGALPKITAPIKLYAGAPLGNGKQYLSWIHIDDLCRLFIHCMENDGIAGAYNGVAPHPVTNEQLTKIAAKALGKPLFLPNVPAAALKLAMGEMAGIVLASARVSSKKVQATGFDFRYSTAKEAIKHLLC